MSEFPKSIQPKTPYITDPRKCPMHNMWMRKGQCEICRLNEDRRRKAYELENEIVKQQVKIGKL